jgi:hypothetical protein
MRKIKVKFLLLEYCKNGDLWSYWFPPQAAGQNGNTNIELAHRYRTLPFSILVRIIMKLLLVWIIFMKMKLFNIVI